MIELETPSIAAFFLIYFTLMFFGGPLVKASPRLFAGLVIGLTFVYLVAMALFSVWCNRERKKMMANLALTETAIKAAKPAWEYRSRFELLGLPFIHIRIGDRYSKPVKAWIAAGDCAFGVLFAF